MSEPRWVDGPPRADLLPRELLERAAVRATRRVVVLLVLLALVVVAGGFALASLARTSSQATLTAAQQRTVELQSRQAEFAEIRQLQRTARETAALAALPEADRIDWPAVIGVALDALPASAIVGTLTFAADSPTSAVEQDSGPYTWPRIGVLELGLHATELETLNAWLDRMRADEAFSQVRMLTVEGPDGWDATATLSLSPALTSPPAAASDEEAGS